MMEEELTDEEFVRQMIDEMRAIWKKHGLDSLSFCFPHGTGDDLGLLRTNHRHGKVSPSRPGR